ncbi:Ras GTPase-activating protein-binding protein 1-like protein isoform X3 [Tanacetum coccineum]
MTKNITSLLYQMLPPPSPTVHSFCNTTPSQPDQKRVSAIPPAGINKSGIRAATEITTIYVGNISCNSTPQVISNYFRKFGCIKGISWRKQRAFAFVKFSSVEQAQQAIIGVTPYNEFARLAISFEIFDLQRLRCPCLHNLWSFDIP